MTDKGNGTYTYEYTIEQSGEISFLIVLLNENGVHGDYFASSDFTGEIATTIISPDLYFDWFIMDIYPGRFDMVTAHFYTYIKAANTESYTFDTLTDG